MAYLQASSETHGQLIGTGRRRNKKEKEVTGKIWISRCPASSPGSLRIIHKITLLVWIHDNSRKSVATDFGQNICGCTVRSTSRKSGFQTRKEKCEFQASFKIKRVTKFGTINIQISTWNSISSSTLLKLILGYSCDNTAMSMSLSKELSVSHVGNLICHDDPPRNEI